MRDTYHNLKFSPALAPVSFTSSAAQTGLTVDRLGHESLTFGLNVGTITTTGLTFTVGLQENDSTSSTAWSAVGSTDLIGAATFTSTDDGVTKKVGYIGANRYARLTVTPSGASTAAMTLSAMAVLGHAHKRPVS